MTAEIDTMRFPLDERNSWGRKIQDSLNLEPRLRDKAIHLICEGLAERAAQEAYGSKERSIVQLVTAIYKQTHERAKRERLAVTDEYARDVYWTIIPELLRANKVSDTFLNSKGSNSIQQIVAVAMALMRAESTRKPVVFLSQMCAQYDSGRSHASDSFARGLLQAIEPEKVARVAEPLKNIGEVLRRHGIPVTYITLQLSPHPKNMLAMVPATVWSYIEEGKVAEMLQTLQTHRDTVDRLLSEDSMWTARLTRIAILRVRMMNLAIMKA